MKQKQRIVEKLNVNISSIVLDTSIYKPGKKKMESINVKVCESTNCCYLKTCKKYLKQKEKENENKSNNLD